MNGLCVLNEDEAWYNGERLSPMYHDPDDYRTWTCRKIFFGRDIVVKIDVANNNTPSDAQCCTELEVLDKAKEYNLDKYLTKIIGYGRVDYLGKRCDYNIHERIRISKSIKDGRFQREMRDVAKKLGLWDYDFEDSMRNVCVDSNGRPVFYDYGLANL